MKNDMDLNEFKAYLKQYGLLKTKKIFLETQLERLQIDMAEHPEMYEEKSSLKTSKLSDMPSAAPSNNSVVETVAISNSAMVLAKAEVKQLKIDICKIKLGLNEREAFYQFLGSEQTFLLEKYMSNLTHDDIAREFAKEFNNGKYYSGKSMRQKMISLVKLLHKTYCAL